MLLATVSHAPYFRGGVRQATVTGQPLFCWGWSCCYTVFLIHGSQHLSEWDGCETRGVIGQTIGNDQFAIVE